MMGKANHYDLMYQGASFHYNTIPLKNISILVECVCAHLQPAERISAALPPGSVHRRHPQGKTWP